MLGYEGIQGTTCFNSYVQEEIKSQDIQLLSQMTQAGW